MNANTAIVDLLAAPLSPDWTIEGLAEQLLDAIAAQQPDASDAAQEIVLDAGAVTDRQSSRLLRPLLACLAAKSAVEASTAVNLYTGRLCFKRSSQAGPVWITGQFDNLPGAVRIALRRCDSAPEFAKTTILSSPSLTPQRQQQA